MLKRFKLKYYAQGYNEGYADGQCVPELENVLDFVGDLSDKDYTRFVKACEAKREFVKKKQAVYKASNAEIIRLQKEISRTDRDRSKELEKLSKAEELELRKYSLSEPKDEPKEVLSDKDQKVLDKIDKAIEEYEEV